jgi:hypothetical protein
MSHFIVVRYMNSSKSEEIVFINLDSVTSIEVTGEGVINWRLTDGVYIHSKGDHRTIKHYLTGLIANEPEFVGNIDLSGMTEEQKAEIRARYK